MLVFVIEDQPHRTGTDLRRKLVACLLVHGSTFSGVGASGKPGAVHQSSALAYHVTGSTADQSGGYRAGQQACSDGLGTDGQGRAIQLSGRAQAVARSRRVSGVM